MKGYKELGLMRERNNKIAEKCKRRRINTPYQPDAPNLRNFPKFTKVDQLQPVKPKGTDDEA